MVYVAVQVGCLECGKDSRVRVFVTREAAQAQVDEWEATANVPEANAFFVSECAVEP